MRDEVTRSMARTLARGLSERSGHPVEVRHLKRHAYTSGSSFAVERLEVALGDGRELEVFFKDLDPVNQREVARRLRTSLREEGLRELLVYQRLLSRHRLGTPELYASRWDPRGGRRWLFLEYAGVRRLNGYGGFGHWREAARWAARFHVLARSLPQRSTAFLPRYDERHYLSCVEPAERALRRLDGDARALVRKALRAYRGLAPGLATLPTSVIHGEYFGRNIVVRRRSDTGKIAVVDWESAAIGPSYLDLVSLTAGRWTLRQRQAMWDAYADEYERIAGVAIDRGRFREELGQLALYSAIRWLGWWTGGDDIHLERWRRELELVLREVYAPSAALAEGRSAP